METVQHFFLVNFLLIYILWLYWSSPTRSTQCTVNTAQCTLYVNKQTIYYAKNINVEHPFFPVKILEFRIKIIKKLNQGTLQAVSDLKFSSIKCVYIFFRSWQQKWQRTLIDCLSSPVVKKWCYGIPPPPTTCPDTCKQAARYSFLDFLFSWFIVVHTNSIL